MNKGSLLINLANETEVECEAIGEGGGVGIDAVCDELIEFALQLYKEGKMKGLIVAVLSVCNNLCIGRPRRLIFLAHGRLILCLIL